MKQPELGKKIAELRRSKGLTQEELVDMCNISVRTIQRIETGEVTPRSYTIKAILSALGGDIEDIQEEKKTPLDLERSLRLAWIFGSLYLFLGILEGPMDVIRISGDVSGNYFLFPIADFSQSFYIIIKALVLVTFIFFFRGFVALGSQFNNSLLKITSVTLISFMVFSISHDIISLYYNPLHRMIVLTGISVVFGVLGILFGVALIQLRSLFGNISLIAGFLEIIAGCLFLVTNPVGFPIQMVAGLLQVMILYQAISNKRAATTA